ncbi:glycosyltransferase family 2 protein [Candidatus Binatus sp.]|uniref:glycosyltransferase family 2 protein n=1 Tax=Candidatus Binatus sp. TaxID=2811406 RepID=UPI002F94448C
MSSVSTATAPSPQSGRPLVSILVINYNYGRFLRSAVDSALAQTYPNVEVIAVDDGSTDASRDVIESYGSRISSVFKRNGGHGSALNAGFTASRGELVIFLDADDELLPTAAAEVVEAWRPGIAKVQFQLEMVDANKVPLGIRVPKFEVFLPNGDLRNLIRRCGEYPSASSSGNAFNRAALERLMPLDEQDWTAVAEKPLVTLTPFFGDVVSLRKSLGLYRIHDTNESNLGGRYLDRLHRRLTGTSYLPETLCKTAKRKGIDLDTRVVGSTLRMTKMKISSLRLDPATHPIAADSRFGLLVKGIRALAREPNLSMRNRLANAVWLTMMAVGPMAVVRRLTAPER